MGKRLWVERNKDGSWDAFGEDGAHIKFGKGRGQFTPGDLMKIALAGCAALSSQFAIEHTLGEGKGAKIVVHGEAYVRGEDSGPHGRHHQALTFSFFKKKGDCNAFRSVAIAFLYVPVEFTDDRDRSWFRWLRPHPARPWKPAPPRHP